MASAPVAISFRELGLRFGHDEQTPLVIDGLNLDVSPGEFLCIVGPTGCGKSSLLNLLAGLTLPSFGQILLNGEPLRGLNRAAGYLFQADALLPWCTARDNVAAGLQFRGSSRAEARRIADEWLARVGLGEAALRYPHELSGGMKKRVALAQMLAIDPQLLLLDEPFSALDFQTRILLQGDVKRIIAERGKSAILVTHDIGEALTMADRILVLSHRPGRIRSIHAVDLDRSDPDPIRFRRDPRFQEYFELLWAELEVRVQAN